MMLVMELNYIVDRKRSVNLFYFWSELGDFKANNIDFKIVKIAIYGSVSGEDKRCSKRFGKEFGVRTATLLLFPPYDI